MDEVTVYNMGKNRLYQFDEDKYVWKRDAYSTRAGNYPAREPITVTEVYQKGNGYVTCIASGNLNNNKYTNRPDEFTIFDYDKDLSISYGIKMPLKEANKETYELLREDIAQLYKSRSM